ncbi:uncharacterized protein LOC113776872 [Coffea eugenioides]|uniref:uncharacterized protein LOC113776872 n=1 Tax=Coffea eugenioides TaxID=49369 RepID=UPI000F60E449|nr:uncharacterized protein LOC113776872 [Coffea eugenioides]
MANAPILRELAAPNFNQQSLCITFPNLDEETPFELKFGLIQLLPSFHDFSDEEPYRHLQEFDVSMKPLEITEEQIKMRAFPFSLKDAAKDWFYYLPPSSITTWEQLKKKCPQQQISEQLLIQYFYEGLLYTDRSLIDTVSGGALMNKTPQNAWKLIERMVENSQQFGTRGDVHTRRVNEVIVSSIQQQISELTSTIRQLAVGNLQQAKTCGICKDMSHLTDWCPVLQDEGVEQVTMASNMQQDFQPQYLSKSQSHSSNADMSLEDTIKTLVANTMQLQQNAIQYQQRTGMSIRNVENQLSQMVSTIHRLESQEKGRLPSQPEVNPKNVSAITFRSGKEIKGPTVLKDKSQDQIQKEIEDKRHEWVSTINKLISPIYEELPSQTINDLKEDENAIILTSDMVLQESQEKGSKDAVKKKVECKK